MKKIVLLIALTLAVSTTFANKVIETHLKGYIDDSHCAGSKTAICTEATRANCMKMCLKSGSVAVLVVGDKVYKISNQSAVTKYFGKKVTIDGKLNNDIVEITKVTETKA